MKVLIINACWEGASTGKIAYGLFDLLNKNGHESKLLYGMGKIKSSDPNVIKVNPSIEPKIHYRVNLITGYHGRFAPIALRRTKKIIKEFKPDIVQLYNMHGYYMNIYGLFDFLKKRNIPIVYGMLDEYPYLGYCCYSYDCDQFMTGCHNCELDLKGRHLKSLFFNRAEETVKLKEKSYDYDKIVFTGPQWVVNRAKSSYLLKDKDIRTVDEYIDTDHTFVIKSVDELRKKHNIDNDKIVVLNVGPFSDKRKGVEYYLNVARIMNDPAYVFINVGYDGELDHLPPNFIPVPYVSNQNELADYYSMADVLVCTSFADTMPNVCLDALACGTPVVGFDISGVPYVATEPFGKFVEPGNVSKLAEAIIEFGKKNEKMKNECREYALSRYSPQKYYSDMTSIYEEMLK